MLELSVNRTSKQCPLKNRLCTIYEDKAEEKAWHWSSVDTDA